MKVQIEAVVRFEADLWEDFEGYEGATTPAEIAAIEKAILETNSEQLSNTLADQIDGGEYEVSVTVTPLEAPVA